jgi:1-phosphatidylinositol-3-phosphate 5-kinase
MLANSRAEKRQSREPRLTDGGEAFMPDDRSVAGSTSTWGVVHIDPSENADPTDELKPHRLSFHGRSVRFHCCCVSLMG